MVRTECKKAVTHMSVQYTHTQTHSCLSGTMGFSVLVGIYSLILKHDKLESDSVI